MKAFRTKRIASMGFIMTCVLGISCFADAKTWSVKPPKKIGPPISVPMPPSPPAPYPIPSVLIEQGLCYKNGQISRGRFITLLKPRIESTIRESHEILNEIGHFEEALDRKHINKPEPRNAINAIGVRKNRTEGLLKKLKEMEDRAQSCLEVISFLQEARDITMDAEKEIPPRLYALEERIRDALKKEKVKDFPKSERYIDWLEWEKNPFCFWPFST